MNKKTLMVSLILMAVFISSFVGPVLARPFYKIISVEKAYRLILSKGHPDLLVIDIRPSNLYAAGHIPGAINVAVFTPAPDWSVLEDWINSNIGQSHRNDKIIIHCFAGLASLTGAQDLVDAGFKKVMSLEGGFFAWEDAGYPIATGL